MFRFDKVNSLPALASQLTPKKIFDSRLSKQFDEETLLSFERDEISDQQNITGNTNVTSAEKILEIVTKEYVDCFQGTIDFPRRDTNLTFLNSIDSDDEHAGKR